jgi:hypothetical protein
LACRRAARALLVGVNMQTAITILKWIIGGILALVGLYFLLFIAIFGEFLHSFADKVHQ